MTKQASTPVIFQTLTEIGIIQQLALSQLEHSLPDGLKASQFAVLNHLARMKGEWSPLRLASAMQVTKGAMTNTLQRLEKRGLIVIVNDASDGRKKMVNITSKGHETRSTCIANIVPLLTEISEEISAEEISHMLPTLEKLRKFLDAKRD